MRTETMTPRERVLAAIRHQQPDRVPFGLGGHTASGISAYAYHRLREHLGLPQRDIWMYQLVQGTCYVDQDVMDRFHLDTVLITPKWKRPIRWRPREGFEFLVSDSVRPEPSEDGGWLVRRGDMRMRMPKGGFFFDGGWITENEYEDKEAMWKDYAANAERIYKETEYFTMMPNMLDSFSGDMDMYCDMYTDPERVVERQQRALAGNLENAERILKHCGPYIQGVTMSGDLGMQTGPMLSPEMYEQFCYPYLKQVCGFIHAHSDLKVFFHCCGSIQPLIPLLLDAGIDILNPVQISAANMVPQTLKSRFGDRLAFWGGGCDTQEVLPKGTPADISAHVKGLMDTFKRGGGFVFAPVHNIMGDVPPENIVAMMDAAYENSFYE